MEKNILCQYKNEKTMVVYMLTLELCHRYHMEELGTLYEWCLQGIGSFYQVGVEQTWVISALKSSEKFSVL